MIEEFIPEQFISPEEEQFTSVQTFEFVRNEAIAAFDDIAVANEVIERKLSLLLTATSPTLLASIGFFFARGAKMVLWEKIAVWVVIFAMLVAVVTTIKGLQARKWYLKGGHPQKIFRPEWHDPDSTESERKKYLIQSIRSYQLRLIDHEGAHADTLSWYNWAITFCLLGSIVPGLIALLSFG